MMSHAGVQGSGLVLLAAQSMSTAGAMDGAFVVVGLAALVLWLLLAGTSLAYLLRRHRRHGPSRHLGWKIAGALLLPALSGLVGTVVAIIVAFSPGTGFGVLLVPLGITALQLVYLRLVR